MRIVWQGARSHIYDRIQELGYTELNPAHLNLFRTEGLDGRRPGELTSELYLSKQSVNDLLRDLEDMGYIRREVDPADRRGRIIRLTPEGRDLEDRVYEAARDVERKLEKAFGRKRLRELRQMLIEAASVFGGRADSRDQPPGHERRLSHSET